MRARFANQSTGHEILWNFLSVPAIVLLLSVAPSADAESADISPAALNQQRVVVILKAVHTPLPELENDVNHLAVLSEMCRAGSGAKACGLSDNPLDSTALEDRFAYYVRKPVDELAGARRAKIDRHNWETPAAPPR